MSSLHTCPKHPLAYMLWKQAVHANCCLVLLICQSCPFLAWYRPEYMPAHHSALIHREQERREERQRIRSEAGGVLDPMDEEGSFDDGDPYTTNLYIGRGHLQSCWECTQILLAPESAAYLCLHHHTQHLCCAAAKHYSFYIRTVHVAHFCHYALATHVTSD